MPPIGIVSYIPTPEKKSIIQTQKDDLILLSGPAGTITEGLNWSEVSCSPTEGFSFCHSAEHFVLYSSVYRDPEEHTDRNTVKVCCLCRQVESFKMRLFLLQLSPSLQTYCCSERGLWRQGQLLLHVFAFHQENYLIKRA